MTMVADTVDAVIGGDTHRDTHALEMTAPNGATSPTPSCGSPSTPPAPVSWSDRRHPQLRNRPGSRVDRCRTDHRRGRVSPWADTAPRQVRPGDPTLTRALHRPRALPHPERRCRPLTNREPSSQGATNSTWALEHAMTTAYDIDLRPILTGRLTDASPDLLRSLLSTFIDALMGARGRHPVRRPLRRTLFRIAPTAATGADTATSLPQALRAGRYPHPRRHSRRRRPQAASGSHFPDLLLQRSKRAERALTRWWPRTSTPSRTRCYRASRPPSARIVCPVMKLAPSLVK